LMVPGVWGATLPVPLLILLADGIGIVGGYLVAVILMGSNPVSYWSKTFQYMDFGDLISGIVKAAAFGRRPATIGCMKGFYTRGGAEGVGKATTQAVVMASI